MAKNGGCVTWKEAKAALETWPLSVAESEPPQTILPHRKVRCAEHMHLGEGWNHFGRMRRFVKATNPPKNPTPSPQPVTEAHKQPEVTATRMTARIWKSAPRISSVKPKKKAAGVVKTEVAKTTKRNLLLPNEPSLSQLEEIPDPLHSLPSKQVWSNFSLPTGAAHPLSVLKTIILFVAEYSSMP